MFFDGHCVHCNNYVTEEAKAAEYSRLLGLEFPFCKKSCFDAEINKRMSGIPSKEQKRQDEKDDREWYKLYKDQAANYENEKYIQEIQHEYNERIAKVRADREIS